MSERRRYLVTYDIGDDRRRTRVFNACRQQGDHMQYSVFIAELNQREFIRFQAELEALIHRDDDQVLFADLGPADHEAGRIIASVGRPFDPPVRVIVV
jgi:CRISPR-associated protein Cas2